MIQILLIKLNSILNQVPVDSIRGNHKTWHQIHVCLWPMVWTWKLALSRETSLRRQLKIRQIQVPELVEMEIFLTEFKWDFCWFYLFITPLSFSADHRPCRGHTPNSQTLNSRIGLENFHHDYCDHEKEVLWYNTTPKNVQTSSNKF